MIDIDLFTVISAFISIFFGSLIKGAIGFGLPVIVTPIMIFFLPLTDVIALQIMPICISNIQQCWATRSRMYILNQFYPMIVANIVILLLGSFILVRLNPALLMPIIGILIILQAVFSRLPFFNINNSSKISPAIIISGIFSGILGSISSFYAFPSVQVLVATRLKRDEFIFIVGFFLSTGFIALWIGILVNGFPVIKMLPLSLILTLPSILGMSLGNIIRKNLNSKWFYTMVRIMLIMTGTLLIGKSLIF